jgi:membrane-associated phospholipid phosphatase
MSNHSAVGLKTPLYSGGRIAAIAALLAFVPVLGLLIGQGFGGQVDWTISQLTVLHGDASDGLWATGLKTLTWLGHFGPRTTIAALLAILVYRWRGPLGAAILLGCSLLASGYSSLLKAIFDRPRPDIIPHLDAVTSASFPSGHATGATVLYVMLAMLVPPKFRVAAWIFAVVMISLMSISRLALGVHWMTDLLGGVAIGVAFALLARPFIAWRA